MRLQSAFIFPFLAVIAFVAMANEARADLPPMGRQQWFEIQNEDGEAIGREYEALIKTASGYVRMRKRKMSYRVDGHGRIESWYMIRREFDKDGELQAASVEENINGQKRQISITFDKDRAVMSKPGRPAFKTVQVPHMLIGFHDSDSLFGLGKMSSRDRDWLAYDLSDSGSYFEAAEYRLTSLPENDPLGEYAYLKRRNGRLAGTILLDYDAQGSLKEARVPMTGTYMSFKPVQFPDEGAQYAEGFSGYNRIAHEQMEPLYRISREAQSGHIRYEFSVAGNISLNLPSTGQQTAVRNGDIWRLDICGECGPEAETENADHRQYLQPAAWMQSDDPQIVKRALGIKRQPVSDTEKMRRLGRITRERLKTVDYEGYFSASSAWDRRRGDCTEDALVYAALARAAGIPAVVANGLVYSRGRYHGSSNAFMSHSWVVAYVDGKWESFDISLDGFDATFIALSIGDGEPESFLEAQQIAALLKPVNMAEIRKRPSP